MTILLQIQMKAKNNKVFAFWGDFYPKIEWKPQERSSSQFGGIIGRKLALYKIYSPLFRPNVQDAFFQWG